MIIPEKINICGREVDIDRCYYSDIATSGCYNNWTSKIKLATKDVDGSRDLLEETLLHEILEAINIMNDLQLDHTTLSTISQAYYQVLKCNGFFKD